MIALIRKTDLNDIKRCDVVDIVKNQVLSSHCLSVYHAVKITDEQAEYIKDFMCKEDCICGAFIKEEYMSVYDVTDLPAEDVFVEKGV